MRRLQRFYVQAVRRKTLARWCAQPFGAGAVDLLFSTPCELVLNAAMKKLELKPTPRWEVLGCSLMFAFPGLRLGVQVDENGSLVSAKRLRNQVWDIRLTRAGWKVLRFTEKEVRTAAGLCALVVSHWVHAVEKPDT